MQPGGNLLHPNRCRVTRCMAQVSSGSGQKAGQCQGETHRRGGISGDFPTFPEVVHRPDEGQRGTLQQQGALSAGWQWVRLDNHDTKCTTIFLLMHTKLPCFWQCLYVINVFHFDIKYSVPMSWRRLVGILQLGKGSLSVPKQMIFRKISKWPLTPRPFFKEKCCDLSRQNFLDRKWPSRNFFLTMGRWGSKVLNFWVKIHIKLIVLQTSRNVLKHVIQKWGGHIWSFHDALRPQRISPVRDR